MEAGLSFASSDLFPGDAISVDFTYHLDTVTTANRPLKEAAFLGHNSNIYASLADYDDLSANGFTLGGEYWADKLYVAAQLDDVDGDQDYDVRVGYMVQDDLLLNAGLVDGDSYPEMGIALGAKYVAKMGENFVNLEGDLELVDGEYTLSLVGDYFFTNELSAGVRIAETSVTGVKTVFGVGASYFFTPVVYADLEYVTQDGDSGVMLRGAMRF